MRKAYAWLFSEGMERDEKIDEINKTVQMLDREKGRFDSERRYSQSRGDSGTPSPGDTPCILRAAQRICMSPISALKVRLRRFVPTRHGLRGR